MYAKIKLCAKENLDDFKSHITTILDYGVALTVERDNLISQKYLHTIVVVEDIKNELLKELAQTEEQLYQENLQNALTILNEMALLKIVIGVYRHEDILDILAVFPESEVRETNDKLKCAYKNAYGSLSFSKAETSFFHNFEMPLDLNLYKAVAINKEFSLNLWEDNTSKNILLLVKEIEKAISRHVDYSDVNAEDINNFLMVLHPNILDEVLKSKKVIGFLLDTEVMGFYSNSSISVSKFNFYQHLFLKDPELVFETLNESEFTIPSLFKLGAYLEKSFLSGSSPDGMKIFVKMAKEFLSEPVRKNYLKEIFSDDNADNLVELAEKSLGGLSLSAFYLIKETVDDFDSLIPMLMLAGVPVDDFIESLKDELKWDLTKSSEKERLSFIFTMITMATILNHSNVDFKHMDFYKESFKEYLDLSMRFSIGKTFIKKDDSIANHLITTLSEINEYVNVSCCEKMVGSNPNDSLVKEFIASDIALLKENVSLNIVMFNKIYPLCNSDNLSKEEKSVLDLLYFTQRVSYLRERFNLEYDFMDLIKECSMLLDNVLPEHIEVLKKQGNIYSKLIDNEDHISDSLLPILMNGGWLKDDIESSMDNFDVKVENVVLERLSPKPKQEVKLNALKF